MTALLQAAQADKVLRTRPRIVLTEVLRDSLEEIRSRMLQGQRDTNGVTIEAVLAGARGLLQSRGATRLVRVINATGVLLHTGLGRSVLADLAIERIRDAAAGHCNLEIDLDTGKRGRRGQYAEQMLCRLTGAEAAMVVNNNAAATMLVLGCLARGKEVLVSRGQLIEIGGSFRLPEVMSAGGAVLREVGTTNKTHLRDYADAISDRTGLIMHVHTSNYRVVGFSESPSLPELAELAQEKKLPLFDDLGSGALLDDPLWTAAAEPTALGSLRDGADVLAFSGDKLLGGPQAGLFLGKQKIIDRLQHDPMARALRIGKLTAAALEATLELYESDRAREAIPILTALSETVESLASRAENLRSAMQSAMQIETFAVSEDEAYAGGGSLPAWPLKTIVVRCQPKCISVDELSRRLRAGSPAVLARIHEGAVVFDLRSIRESESADLVAAVQKALDA
jgi:L-seryl-tRNA(Ser) seleniumtransferase